MNIFYLDKKINNCVRYYNNKHVVKMILEYAQLLSSAHNILDGDKEYLYKTTHKNHPCTKWTLSSSNNYKYLYNLWILLMEEYTFRYEKVHKSERLKTYLKEVPKNINNKDFTEPPICMDDIYKINNNCIDSYRNYYIKGKKHINQWKKRNIPNWIKY